MERHSSDKTRLAFAFSAAGAGLTILFFVIVYYTTGSHFPWFIFPCFAVLWWPAAVLFAARGRLRAFSVVGCAFCIALLALVNRLTTPDQYWFFYAAFAALWWPLAQFCRRRGGGFAAKPFALAGSLLTCAFLIGTNFLTLPAYPWFLYTLPPVIAWPVIVLLGRRAARLPVALAGSAAVIGYYSLLNAYLSPGFAWAVCPAFAVLWWPLSAAFAKKSRAVAFSAAGTALSAAFFITLNALTTPHEIWAVYPIFALLWWPLSVCFFVLPRRRGSHAR